VNKLGIWAIAIAAAFLVGAFTTNAYSETVQECEKRIRSDDSLTYAEKTVALKKCDDAEKDYSPKQKDPVVDILIIRYCEDQFEIYELLGKDEFMIMYARERFTNQCVMLYSDSIWEYEGEDRVQVLTNWLNEEIQRQIDEKNTPKSGIPEWIKQVGEFWIEDKIDDAGFVQVIEFLVKEDIITIPYAEPPEGDAATQIPSWIKSNTEFWVTGKISDDEFTIGLEWLINNGIIRV